MYAAGKPARSAASGWPWPDIRWHAPHANLLPGPPATDGGAGGCSSGNQSGGFVFPETLAHSYSLALPGALTMPCGRTAVGWTLSGILNVQSGSPSGTLSSSCALRFDTMSSGARAHTRTAMRTDVFVRITAGLPFLTKVIPARYRRLQRAARPARTILLPQHASWGRVDLVARSRLRPNGGLTPRAGFGG